jgi:eukaryotic-like serine/threonine-protein kinase
VGLKLTMAFAAGTHFGIYQVTGLIGIGGMGEVYRATDTTLGREVAIKVLPDSFAADADRAARFEREAKTLASLNHTNIGQIYGLERRDGTTALVMELVEGLTLAHRLMQGPIPVDEALSVALQIADALEAAHALGIVHRDLKPANIKLRPDGTVKVLDFGIAKALNTRAISSPEVLALTAPAMTEAGIVLGTAAYMSPEQARGKPVDQRADIWAFGCVLCEMFTGRPAFGADDVTATLARVLERDPDMHLLPTGLPPPVRRTLELCLQKDVKDRLRHIGDARLALEGRFAVPAPAARARPPWSRTLPAAATLVIAALGTGVYVAMRAPAAVATSPLPVTRFVVTPPATAPLSNLGGHDFALSPDGRRLAYLGQNAAKNGVALYVRELDALEPRLLPGTEVLNPWPNVNPFFSPDGKSIGFAAPDGSVIRARVDGAPPPLKMFHSDLIFGASWIADDAVVVATGARLERVSIDGAGTPEPLTQEVANQLVASPSVLPGGRAVLFMSRAGVDLPRVAVLDLETGEEKILIEGGQKPLYASTGHIVFARGATLMAAPFNAAEQVLTGEPVALLENLRRATNNSPDYALSATGTLAYVPADDEERWRGALIWVDRKGTVLGRVVGESLDEPDDPRLSPDGTRVVVTVGAVGEGRLWAYDLRGRPPIPLAAEGGAGDAVWSPDSREIAFSAFNTTNWQVSTLSSNGSGLAQRMPSAAGIAQDWSTAGELLFVSGRDIHAAPVAGGEARNVIATDDNEFDAALSPNGRWLAYVSDRTGQAEVWVQGYPDGVPVPVSSSGGYEPRWSGDGKEIFYLQGSSMYAVAVDTEAAELSFEAPVLLFSGSFFAAPSAETRSYDVARDGRFLMIQREDAVGANDGPASIVVVENWFEELKRRVPTE